MRLIQDPAIRITLPQLTVAASTVLNKPHPPSGNLFAVAENVYVGRAGEDGVRNQGWLLGHFMPAGDLLHSDEVEVKWGVHPPGQRRAAWATRETRTALLVLIRGAFDIELRDRTVLLREPGDYVVWGPGEDHSWQAGADETVVLTVRWPSIPGWRLPSPSH